MHQRYLPIVLLFLFVSGVATAAPRVVVSLVPIHSLVAGVMEGVGEPELLIHGGESPHSFSLRPSQAHTLQGAQLVVWVGPDLEVTLEKSIATLATEARVITLAQEGRIEPLPLREGGKWDAHDHGASEGHSHGADQHIWLSPRNGGRIVRIMMDELSRLDPTNKTRYRKNAQALLNKLARQDKELKSELAEVNAIPYMVFHDAYQYFEVHYDLKAIGSITVSPEQTPGAKRLSELRRKIRNLEVRCIFSEPQFEPRLVDMLIEGSNAKSGVLDPLGAELTPGPEAYFKLLHNLASSLTQCLSQQ
ncbi:MAG: zinc ABC transporter substrate-binding protein [Sedimenticola sp.]